MYLGMTVSGSLLHGNTLAALSNQAGGKVTSAIQKASSSTGVDFAYLLQQAKVESSFRTDVKASTSSATGLFQFIDSTWMNMVENHGEKYGIDPSAPKSELLALRKDPEISSLMAAELASENKNYLENTLGKGVEIGSTELYMAHFLGAGKAAGFLKAFHDAPQKPAADLFPRAAQANRAVFYNTDGKPKSLGEVYANFEKKFSVSGGQAPAETAVAAATIQPDYNSQKLERYMQKMQAEKASMGDDPQKFAEMDALTRMAASNPYMDLLSFGVETPTPIMRKSGSKFPSMGVGNMVQNPADILWLAQLDDSLGSKKALR